MFKKGQLVTRIASWNSKGSVYVEHFKVGSWGKKQATLIRQDGSNAEFRVYTQRANLNQGTYGSSLFVLTADYNLEVAKQFAHNCLIEEHNRIEHRWAYAQARFASGEAPYAGTREENLEFERNVFTKSKAELQATGTVVEIKRGEAAVLTSL